MHDPSKPPTAEPPFRGDLIQTLTAIVNDSLAACGGPLSLDQVHEIFRKIAAGERRHGNFLTKFAQALMAADDENEVLLQPAALGLIVKYQLASYAQPDREESAAHKSEAGYSFTLALLPLATLLFIVVLLGLTFGGAR